MRAFAASENEPKKKTKMWFEGQNLVLKQSYLGQFECA